MARVIPDRENPTGQATQNLTAVLGAFAQARKKEDAEKLAAAEKFEREILSAQPEERDVLFAQVTSLDDKGLKRRYGRHLDRERISQLQVQTDVAEPSPAQRSARAAAETAEAGAAAAKTGADLTEIRGQVELAETTARLRKEVLQQDATGALVPVSDEILAQLLDPNTTGEQILDLSISAGLVPTGEMQSKVADLTQALTALGVPPQDATTRAARVSVHLPMVNAELDNQARALGIDRAILGITLAETQIANARLDEEIKTEQLKLLQAEVERGGVAAIPPATRAKIRQDAQNASGSFVNFLVGAEAVRGKTLEGGKPRITSALGLGFFKSPVGTRARGRADQAKFGENIHLLFAMANPLDPVNRATLANAGLPLPESFIDIGTGAYAESLLREFENLLGFTIDVLQFPPTTAKGEPTTRTRSQILGKLTDTHAKLRLAQQLVPEMTLPDAALDLGVTAPPVPRGGEPPLPGEEETDPHVAEFQRRSGLVEGEGGLRSQSLQLGVALEDLTKRLEAALAGTPAPGAFDDEGTTPEGP
jgi:hypothetical protein